MGSSLNVGGNRNGIQLFLGRAARRQIFLLLCLCSVTQTLVISSLARTQSAGTYWPTHSWRTSTPEAQGFDSDELTSVLQTIRERNIQIHSLLIERNGYLILDSYFFPFKDGEKHDIASATKSVTSTLIGIAIGEGRLAGVEQPVLSVFSDPSISYRDARKERMTIGDFLTMRSGLDCHSEQGELTLTQMRASAHWVPFMLNLPMTTDPGSMWVYCSGGMHVLSGVISRVTGRNAFQFAQDELFAPLGIRDASWPSDPDGVSDGWGDLRLQPRDMAKVGYLWLHGGSWEARQIVPAGYMRAAAQPHSLTPEYGYGFWIYQERRPAILENVGRVFEANGRGGQRIWVAPEADMVVVMTGGGFEPADIGGALLGAFKSHDSLPQNAGGDARLAGAVLAAAKPPPAHQVAALPSVAISISGRAYPLEENILGIRSLALSFTSSPPSLSLVLADGRKVTRPLGLDGTPRVSSSRDMRSPVRISLDGYGETSVALSGAWEDDRTFALDYDSVGNINDYRMRLTFADREVNVEVRERTGLVHENLRGHLP